MVTVRLVRTAPDPLSCIHCIRLKHPPCFEACRTNLQITYRCIHCGIQEKFPAQGYEKACKNCGKYSNVEYMIADTIHARGNRLQYHVMAG